MAIMTTTYGLQDSSSGKTTYWFSGHTAVKPRLMIQRSKAGSGKSPLLEDSFAVHTGCENADGLILPSLSLIQLIVRRDRNAVSTDIDVGRDLMIDFVTSDFFPNMINLQRPVPFA